MGENGKNAEGEKLQRTQRKLEQREIERERERETTKLLNWQIEHFNMNIIQVKNI